MKTMTRPVTDGVDLDVSSAISQCSTLEFEEAQNAQERATRETPVDGSNGCASFHEEFSNDLLMKKQVIEMGLSDEDAETALRETDWYTVELAVEWHFNRNDRNA